jgi:acyl dehydratase
VNVAEAPRDRAVGAELPPLEVDVTTTLIVTGAIASRDFYAGHHDRDFARKMGSEDVFMNVMTANGLVSRYITDWAGPTARLTRMKLRLGAPNYPGDRMVLRGVIAAVAEEADELRLVIDVVGTNGIGDHVRGDVALTISINGDRDSAQRLASAD